MSQAKPMSQMRRQGIYVRQNGRVIFTDRQRRQIRRLADRDARRWLGWLSPHGATGIPIRKPLTRARDI